MATTLSSITTEIASHLGKELDEPFKRMLAGKVNAWRGTLIRRTLNENPKERVHFRQTIYIKMTTVAGVPECLLPGAPVCEVMQSTAKIPKPVRTSVLYDFVGSIDGATAFRLRQPGTGAIMTAGKYSGKVVEYDTMNEYLELYNAIGMPVVRIDGVFADPDEVAKFNCATTGGDCDSWDLPYPVSEDIHQAIVQCILTVDYGKPTTPADKAIEVTPQKQEHAPDGR